MSRLVLVRHGQASMFTDNYDELSPIGEIQSQRLGSYWINNNVTFDEVYIGPRDRQIRTEELVSLEYRKNGKIWPEPVIVEELDEYDGDGILKEFLHVLCEQDEKIRDLAATYRKFVNTTDRYRHFQRMFEAITRKWVEAACESPNVESWKSFHDRVRRALNRIISNHNNSSGRRIAVFTSGGPISIFVQTAVNAPEMTALELNWRIRNCSLTEIMFTRDRLTLDAFNAISHLDEPSLLTYR